MSYRSALIFVNEEKAGRLEETSSGFIFQYDGEYINKENAEAVSLTLPIRKEAYEAEKLFPFFEGLIPEGWLLHIVEQTWDVDPKDRMGVLLVSCQDTVGNVSVRPL